MKWLPKEHGLSVNWVTVLLLSILLAKRINPWGLALFLLVIPTISLYDPFLSSMRLWKLKKKSLFQALWTNLNIYQWVLIFAILVLAVLETVEGFFPFYALLFPVLPLIISFPLMMKFAERHITVRTASILFVIGQFVLLNSALTGTVTISELTDYVFLVLINVILIISVRLKIDSIISKKVNMGKTGGTILSMIIISGAVLFLVSGYNLIQFYAFLFVAILTTVSYPLVPLNSIKKVGILSTMWTVSMFVVLLSFSFF